MQLNSLARRSDLIFARFEGEVLERDDYMVVRTPGNPGYHWGNYLIFEQEPQVGDFERWQALFQAEFADMALRHQVFSWNPGPADPGQVAPFVTAGFSLDRAVVLTAKQVLAPPYPRDDLSIRPLQSDADWEQAIVNQYRCRDPQFDGAGYWGFKRRQFASYRAMAEQGLGAWFGAFVGEQLVADLGVFYDGRLGRYQNVGTDPAFRRQGICATLVSQTANYALSHWPIDVLVMEADADYHAARIYESVGFAPVETNYSLSWWE
ncbi:MAG: N-acetyltransferase [Candidatus Melainabacteria bacterium HGW-Melainabacteria-1]|nr:MAG: N-acetyltransferase [Candidatus Melainabacteria bacterium HGW-Melainabacteria-1]